MSFTTDDAEQERRLRAIEDLFVKWDLGGNCCIRFSELLQILQASQRLSTKDQQKWVKRLEAQIEQARRFNSQHGSFTALNLANGGVVTFGDVTGEPSLDPKAFHTLIMHLTTKDNPQEFDEFVKFCGKAVLDASESTQGSKVKRDIWEMFRLLDANNDGFVDLHELEDLVGHQSKKQLVKWRHYLTNKAQAGVAVPEVHSRPRPLSPTAKRDDESSSDEDNEAERRALQLTLADFQKFVHEYVEKSEEERVPELLMAVRKESQKRSVRYIVQFKVHEIINDVMEDLLKEKPNDVLAGIAKSVERLRRTGKYPVKSTSKSKLK